MDSEGKGKIKTKKGFVIASVMSFFAVESVPSLVALGIIALAFFVFTNARGETNSGNFNGTSVQCGKWSDVGEQEQALIKKASNDAGIHPALLAAIYWQENGKHWKAMTEDFACGTNGCGPFQLNSANRKAYGLSEAEAKDFAKSVGPAAKILRSGVDNLGVNGLSEDENTTRAVALAYNRGACVAKKWVADGNPLSAEKIKQYQDDCNYATSVYPKSGFSPMELAEIGLDYLMSAGGMFRDLAKGCDQMGIIGAGTITDTGGSCSAGYSGRQNAAGFIQLPRGQSYYSTAGSANGSQQWGTSQTVNLLMATAKKFYADTGIKLTFGDISSSIGGSTGIHRSHKLGKSVDISIPGQMMIDAGVSDDGDNRSLKGTQSTKTTYDRTNAMKLAQMLVGCKCVKQIIYDDNVLISQFNKWSHDQGIYGQYGPTAQDIMVDSDSRVWGDHSNHFHIEVGILKNQTDYQD